MRGPSRGATGARLPPRTRARVAPRAAARASAAGPVAGTRSLPSGAMVQSAAVPVAWLWTHRWWSSLMATIGSP